MAPVNYDAAHFEALYRKNPDPWDFRTSAYERDKYATTVRALPRRSYRHLLELGSSIGELTALLTPCAERVTGVETSAAAIAHARTRCAALAHVDFVQAHLPAGPWGGRYDAVVMSEVLYYLDVEGIQMLVDRLNACAAQADLVLVHWTGPTDYPLSGDAAANAFLALMPSDRWMHTRTPRFRLDLLRRDG